MQRSKHGTIYFFRRRVPEDVQHIVKRKQVYKSLATCDRCEAIADDLPELIVKELSDKEISRIRKKRSVGVVRAEANEVDVIGEEEFAN